MPLNHESFDVEPDGQDEEEQFTPYQWKTTVDGTEPCLTKQASHLLGLVSAVCSQIVHPSGDTNLGNVLQLLDEFRRTKQRGSNNAQQREGHIKRVMMFDTLDSLAERCFLADQASHISDFVYMIACIQFRMKVIR